MFTLLVGILVVISLGHGMWRGFSAVTGVVYFPGPQTPLDHKVASKFLLFPLIIGTMAVATVAIAIAHQPTIGVNINQNLFLGLVIGWIAGYGCGLVTAHITWLIWVSYRKVTGKW